MVLPIGFDIERQDAPPIATRPLPESDRAIVIVGTSLGNTPAIDKPALIHIDADTDIGTTADPKVVSATGTLRNAILDARSRVRDDIILAVAEDPESAAQTDRLAAVDADYDKLVAAAHLSALSQSQVSVRGTYFCAPDWDYSLSGGKPTNEGANPVVTALKAAAATSGGICVAIMPPQADDTPWTTNQIIKYAADNGGQTAFIVAPTFYTGSGNAKRNRSPAPAICAALASIHEAETPIGAHVNVVGLPDQALSHNPNLGADSDTKTLSTAGVATLVQDSGGWQIWGADLAVGASPAQGVEPKLNVYLADRHIDRALDVVTRTLVNLDFADVFDVGKRAFEHALENLAATGYIAATPKGTATKHPTLNTPAARQQGRAYFVTDYMDRTYTRRISVVVVSRQ